MSHAEAPLGLRERKHRRTKAAIQRAAAELTLEDGFQGATISRIAERADVSPRTVSTYFAGKDEIFFADTPELFERFQHFMSEGTGSTVDRLQQWIDHEADLARAEAAQVGEEEMRAQYELRALQHRAIMSDPELRAKEARVHDPLGDALATAFAAETGQRPTDLGPRVFAGATFGVFMELRARSMPGAESLDLVDVHRSLEFLRAGTEHLATAREGAAAPATSG